MLKTGLCVLFFVLIAFYSLTASRAGSAQGWRAGRELADAAAKRRPEINYYEEKVPDYSLPEILVAADGTRITTAQMWKASRRDEILELFRKHVYGRSPGRPDNQTFEVVNVDPKALDGQATLKRVKVTVEGPKGQLSTTMSIFLPNSAKKPVPLFLLLSHRSPDSTDWTRKMKRPFWSVEQIVARGYGTAAIQVTDFAPDRRDGWKHGVHTIFDDPGKGSGDGWGTLTAWAWTGSRAMDYFETDDDLASAETDLWADPQGEFLAGKHAGEVYSLFGLKGLDAESIPPVESPVHTGRIGHHIHAGGHDLTEYDWQRFMDFADEHLRIDKVATTGSRTRPTE